MRKSMADQLKPWRARWRSACSMCMGTDCEAECRQGQCYADELRQRQEDESSENQWLERGSRWP